MIGVLQLARTYGAAALQQTVMTAVTLGCTDQAAVRHLLLTATLARPPSIRCRLDRRWPAMSARTQASPSTTRWCPAR